jgi:hypothetical protein
MSTSATVPMVNAQGEAYDIPLAQMPDAARSGLQMAVDMKHAGTGERYTIPSARYKEALAGGMVPDSGTNGVPVPAGLQGPPSAPEKSMGQRALDLLNYPLMSKLSPTYQADRQTDETLAHGPTTPYEQEHPALGYVRRKLAQGALMAEDAITPGTVATAALGGVGGIAGGVGTAARVANKTMSGVYGAQSLKSGYDAATNSNLSTTDRLTGAGLGLVGGALGAVDIGAGKPLAAPLQNDAESAYSKFLNPTTAAMKDATQQVVPGLLDKGVRATSLSDLSSTAAQNLENIGQQIDQHASAIPGNVRPDMGAIMQKLNDFQDGFSVNGQVVDQAGHDSAQRMIDTLGQFGSGQSPIEGLNTNPSFQDMRNVRQVLDRGVAQSGGFLGKDLKDASALNAQKTAADAIRGELAKQSPELDALNKQYNFWSNVKDVADASADRKTGQQGIAKYLLGAVAGAGGFAHGGAPGVAEFGIPAYVAGRALTSPIGRTGRVVVQSRVGLILRPRRYRRLRETRAARGWRRRFALFRSMIFASKRPPKITAAHASRIRTISSRCAG